jgi:hypothetical protein
MPSFYYINSLQADTERMEMAVRGNWNIKSRLHQCWMLSTARVRLGCARAIWQENFSILRRIMLNLVFQGTSVKVGVKNCRLVAEWNDAFRQRLLGLQSFA